MRQGTKTMKRAILAIALILVTTVSAQDINNEPKISMEVYGQQDKTETDEMAKVHIKAPVDVKVGDLIILDLSESIGDGFDYEVEPMPPGLRTFDDGRIIVCGTGHKNVVFNFMISCALGNDSDIAVHKVTVTVVGAPVDDSSISKKVFNWAELVVSPKDRDNSIKLAQ